MKILITGACGVTSRAIARSIRHSERYRGAELVGTDVADNAFGLFEGLYRRVHRSPHVSDPGYADWMCDCCLREQPDAAIVIPELEVCFWSERGAFPAPALLPPPRFGRLVLSKARLYEQLAGSGFVPAFRIADREELLSGTCGGPWPMWLRDSSEGTSSGKGSLLARSSEEAQGWARLNPDVDRFMLAEYLPGRNYACHLLFHRGDVAKTASYERLEYFMARAAPSGVTGNICKGRLVRDERLERIAEAAVRRVADATGEELNGMLAVDLKEDADGLPRVTEVNLRYVAAAHAFALAGFNLAEAHLTLLLAGHADLGPRTAEFPPDNMILRDIDGTLIWRAEYRPLEVGEWVEQTAPGVFAVFDALGQPAGAGRAPRQ